MIRFYGVSVWFLDKKRFYRKPLTMSAGSAFLGREFLRTRPFKVKRAGTLSGLPVSENDRRCSGSWGRQGDVCAGSAVDRRY
jgi:hypothetical protein